MIKGEDWARQSEACVGMRDSKTNKISSRVAGFEKNRGILQGARGGHDLATGIYVEKG